MQTVAEYMADLFENNVGEDGEIDIETYVYMSQIFVTVPEDFRAEVFVEFIDELKRREIEFDASQFQNNDVEIVR